MGELEHWTCDIVQGQDHELKPRTLEREMSKVEMKGVRGLSAAELSEVAGGDTMDLIIKAAAPFVLKDCIKKLTREGEAVYCGGEPVDANGNIRPHQPH
jgi:hypothetical protein